MTPSIIDTHTHPFDEAFDDDRAEVMARAAEAGVATMICPAIDSASHDRLFALCDSYPDTCRPTMGLHPTSVNDNPDWRNELDIVASYLSDAGNRRFYAIGEVGLDFYWSRDWQKEQMEAFEAQVDMSLEYHLPLIIHTRDAWPEMLDVLRAFKGRGLRGIMHAFSGTWDDYLAVKECGDFLFGIGGVLTYKKSTLPDMVSRLSIEEMVLETDAPYLPPVPFRGKRNEPSYIVYTCRRAAEAKGISEAEMAATTAANARRMFGL